MRLNNHCLTCWEPFELADAPFVCTNTVNCTISAGVTPAEIGFRGEANKLAEIVQRYAGFQGSSPFATRFYHRSKWRTPKVEHCRKCNRETARRGCPQCWHALDIQDGRAEIIPTVLVGDTGTGKTVLTAAICRQLTRTVGPMTGRVGGPFELDLRTRIIPDLEQGRLPPGTMKRELAAFFEVSMSVGLRHAFMPLRDYQGLAMQDLANQAVLQPDLRQAKHLVFLVDPILSTNLQRIPVSTLAYEILNKVIPDRAREVFVSVVLVKADQVSSSPLHQPIRDRVADLLDRTHNVGRHLPGGTEYLNETRGLFNSDLLGQLGEGHLTRALDEYANKEKVEYFVCSGTGQAPQGLTFALPWTPKCVLDPLIWRMQES